MNSVSIAHADAQKNLVPLSSLTAPSDRAGVVSSVLQLLGLAPAQHRVVGGRNTQSASISGGQRKRVNIGLELVAKPAILFLDEPTSGLDSAVSQDILDYLSVIAKVTLAGMCHIFTFDTCGRLCTTDHGSCLAA